MSRLLAAVGIASLLIPLHAAADAVGPPPTSCPEGAAPFVCHGPSTCRADSCTGDGDCAAGEICESRQYCVREHCCLGGWGGGCMSPSDYVIHVEGPCAAGGSCSAFDTSCRGILVCVPGTRDGGTGTDAGTDAGGGDGRDAGGDGDVDAGSSEPDAGGADAGAEPDAGDAEPDAGGAETDAGGEAMDAGGETDSGAAAMDAGGTPIDAGTGGPTEGGCCSVTGPRESLAAELFGIAFGVVLLRRLRRRR